MKIPILSFFTGGGFLDLGFEAAGFDVRWTNEYNSEFAKIYAAGLTAWRRAQDKNAPAAAISNTQSIVDLDAKTVLMEAFGKSAPDFFGVIGGPPCTDFSVGGLHAGHKGDAGKLTSVYVKMLIVLNPSFFLLENVPHLETHEKHRRKFLALLSKLESAGFSYQLIKLNSLDYGVPQDRLRLFVVGFKRELLRKWYPKVKFPKRALAEFFKWPVAKYPDAKAKHDWPTSIKFGTEPVVPDSIPAELCVSRAVSYLPDPETLPNGKDFFNPYSKKFGTIKEGDVSGKSFKRLHRFRYSPTAWYGNNEVHLHPWKKRRLSVREVLRLQSVPDCYTMPEDVPLCAKFKVVGNGVPCSLAQNIAESVRVFIESNRGPARKIEERSAAPAIRAEVQCRV